MALRDRRHGRPPHRQAAGGGALTARDIAIAAARIALAEKPDGLVVLGIAGAQGSGKSTVTRAVGDWAAGQGIAAALLSIDDLYLTRAEREALARDVHPLLRTRGVPGTHDVALGLDVIAALERGEAAALPRFDKASDDRMPAADWDRAPAHTRLLVLEGWCVGARPQPEAALAEPVNALERDEDKGGVWRGFVNEALAGAYQTLFARIDHLLFLAAPNFDTVLRWRTQQERETRAQSGGGMADQDIARFIAHYERLTRWMLDEMPGRAKMVAWLDEGRGVEA